jgi:signal transduction histidine kinase/ActR/RegA family two-component response regulator
MRYFRSPFVYRAIWVVIGILLFLFCSADLWLRPRIQNRTYRIAAYNSPPYYTVEPGGVIRGLAVDVINEAASRRHIRIEWIPITVPLAEALDRGIVDVVPVVSVTPERRVHFHLSEPWLQNRFYLISLRSSNIKSPGDTDGKAIAHVDLPVTKGFARKQLPKARLIEKASRADALRAVCSGEVLAGFAEDRSLESLLLKRPLGCEQADFRLLAIEDANTGMSIGSNKENAALADALRSEISAMAVDGRLAASLDRWSLFSSSDIRLDWAIQRAHLFSRFGILGSIGLLLTALIAFRLLIENRKVRAAQKMGESANKAKSEFLANMSHEIRTPLNGVLGMTSLALSTPLNPEQREYLEQSKASGESLLTLLNQILDFSKIGAGKLSLEETQFSPSSCLTDSIRILSPLVRAKNLTVVSHVFPDVPDWVIGDQNRLQQILLNLIGNAIKFTEVGGIRISVQVESSSDAELHLHFAIADTGIGIPPEQQLLIFDPFQQADGSTTRKHGGTGLGLSISSQVVQLMAGHLWVESEVGKGSVFHFTSRFLPCLSPKPDHSRQHNRSEEMNGKSCAEAGCSNGIRILLAEDNAVNQKVLSRMLEREGHNVLVVSDGRQALQAFERSSFDLILMDVQMPEMDGLEAAREMRKQELSRQTRTPILAITAHAMKEDRERCLEAGMDEYISKPIKSQELFAVLERLTGTASRLRDSIPGY